MKKVQIAGKLMVAAIAAMCTVFAPEATACSSPDVAGRFGRSRGLAAALESSMDGVLPLARTAIPGNSDDKAENFRDRNPEIVGMWIVTFYVGNTTEVYDLGIQQFYGDGTEMTNSSSFSPLEGNICFGVWQAAGARTFKLRHIGWTFDTNGKFSGTARLSVTLTVSPQGDTYAGSYMADAIDPSGNIVAGSQAKGPVRGRRFKAD